MSRVIDLDAFLAEQNADPLVIRFAGRDYRAPAEIPWVAIRKAQALDGKDTTVDEVGEVIGLIVGRQAWTRMQEDGIGFKASMQVMNALLEEATKGMGQETEQGEGQGDPKAASPSASPSRTSPSGSPSSSRTSGGSIRLAPMSSQESDAAAS